MKILVAGRSGQLAGALASLRPSEVVALGRPAFDIVDAASVAQAVDVHAPDLIVNAAGYTAVDRAENERDAAFAVNADGARNLASEARRHGVPLIHISTDYVFGGAGTRPWREDDPVVPQGVYAKSKLAGEEAVRAETPRHVILRTSWVFAGRGNNFVRAMLRLGRTQPQVRVVDDQWGCPTPAGDLARVVLEIAARPGPFGTYHYCGDGAVTWHGFATEIFARARLPAALVPVSTAQYGAPAPRPAYSVLDAGRIWRDYGIAQRSWREGLDAVLREAEA